MVNSITNNVGAPNFSANIIKLLVWLSGVFLFIVSISIFQDFLEAKRSSYAFYFNESLLFKTIWFLFIPILAVLYKKLEHEKLDSTFRTVIFITSPIVAHFLILPFVAVVLSLLFYEGRYDLYKFFSYTFAQDFYKLVIVYVSFVLGIKYISKHPKSIVFIDKKPTLDTIIINNGKDNVIVKVEDIIQITSETPYIFIHLENKKYLHSETLKSISERLDGDLFIRVHKSTIVNISKVSSFKSRLNGDYDLQLKNGDFVRLSRSYKNDFKKRFNLGHRVKA